MTNSNTKPSEPSKSSGQYHSVKGTVVETVGNVTGSQSWQQAGAQEHAAGEAEVTAAQAQGYVEGVTDQALGYKDSVVGAITGDKGQQVAGNARKEKGNAQQELNKPST